MITILALFSMANGLWSDEWGKPGRHKLLKPIVG